MVSDYASPGPVAAKPTSTRRHANPLLVSHGLYNHTVRDVRTLAESLRKQKGRRKKGRRTRNITHSGVVLRYLYLMRTSRLCTKIFVKFVHKDHRNFTKKFRRSDQVMCLY